MFVQIKTNKEEKRSFQWNCRKPAQPVFVDKVKTNSLPDLIRVKTTSGSSSEGVFNPARRNFQQTASQTPLLLTQKQTLHLSVHRHAQASILKTNLHPPAWSTAEHTSRSRSSPRPLLISPPLSSESTERLEQQEFGLRGSQPAQKTSAE